MLVGASLRCSGASVMRRSTTTSIVCFVFLSRVISSSRSRTRPSTRTRTKPARRASSKTPLVLALPVLDDGREDHQPLAGRHGEDGVDDLLHGLALDGPAAVGAVGRAGAGEEQAQVVVDLGDGADGRARVAAGALLVDGDGRREALDVVDVGLLHLAEELAGVGGERLDITALALGVDGVEGERATCPSRRAR